MAICHKRKLVMLHIPKNAGTAITNTLNMGNPGHFTIRETKVPEGYSTFAVIRDVLNRFISTYVYVRMPESYWHKTGTVTEHPDFHLCNDNTIDEIVDMEYNAFKAGSTIFEHQHFEAQHAYIFKRGKLAIDYTVSQGNLQNDLDSMFDLLDLERVNIPRINDCDSENMPVLSESSIAKVLEIYAIDHAMYEEYK
jgi:hypothetical protein